MLNEERDLLIREVCARIPYEVKCKFEDKVYDILGFAHGRVMLCLPFMSKTITTPLENIELYLLPMSSMTEEHHLEIEILTNGQIGVDKYSLWDFSGCSELSLSQTLEVFNWLNRNHFDYRGLIERGIAIDASGLNIY